MTSEQLHVTQAAARARQVPGRRSDKGSTARVRRAAVEFECFAERDEPIDDAVGPHGPAPGRDDYRPIWFRIQLQEQQGAPQLMVHRNTTPASPLGDLIMDIDDVAELAV